MPLGKFSEHDFRRPEEPPVPENFFFLSPYLIEDIYYRLDKFGGIKKPEDSFQEKEEKLVTIRQAVFDLLSHIQFDDKAGLLIPQEQWQSKPLYLLLLSELIASESLHSRKPLLATKEYLGAGGIGLIYRLAGDSGRVLKLMRQNNNPLLPEAESRLREITKDPHAMTFHGQSVLRRQDQPPHLLHVLDYLPNARVLSETEQWTKATRLGERDAEKKEESIRHVIQQILIPVLRVLKKFHRANLIHRDIKPDNILIALDEEGNHKSYLSDYELVVQPGRHQNSHLQGTAHYMSPEALRNEELSAASDIYSIGILLRELGGIKDVRPLFFWRKGIKRRGLIYSWPVVLPVFLRQ